MSVCAETPRSSFERLAMRACAVCLLLILSLAVHAGATGIRATSGDNARIGLAFAPDSPVAGAHHAASGAVDPATDQPLILLSGTGDWEEDEPLARRPSIPFADRQARVQVSHPPISLNRRRKAFQARAPPASA